MNIDPAHASLFIVNPLTGRDMRFKNLFTTHPPTEERIARLRSFSRERVGTPLSTVVLLGTGNPIPDATGAARPTLVRARREAPAVRCRSRRVHAARRPRTLCRACWMRCCLTHSAQRSHLRSERRRHDALGHEPEPRRCASSGRRAREEVVDGMRAMLRPDVEYRLAHHEDLDLGAPGRSRGGRRPASCSRKTACASSPPRTDHRPVEPTVGFRIEHDGAAVVLAGDTVPCAGLDELCRDADVYVQTVLRDDFVRMVPCAVRRHDRLPLDRRAGRADCGARRTCGTLVLTHQIPTPAPGSADEWIAIAASTIPARSSSPRTIRRSPSEG